jgi:hypothetical protein
MFQRVNPKHPIPDEVVEGFRRYNEREAAAAAQRLELAKLARPTAEEREVRLGAYESILKLAGIDIDQYRSQSLALAKQQFDRINDNYLGEHPSDEGSYFSSMEFEPSEPTDHSFWAADWSGSSTLPYTIEGQADGIHFKGKKTYDGGDLLFLNFGIKSHYAIAPERIPRPESPPWRSAPFVELFGELMAWTAVPGLFDGDRWSKCWMIRRQTLFQWVPLPLIGPFPKVIGEATDVQTIFFEENRGQTVTHRLPGFQWMPQIILNAITPGLEIWAELEVRFDIQLEGNSLLWIHPFDLLLRGFQWPLEAI